MPQLRPPLGASTTPVTDRRSRYGLAWTVVKAIGLPAAPIIAMMIWGQPALRMQYWYVGHHDYPSSFERCIYLSLAEGWHDIVPAPGPKGCPLVALFPFDIADFVGDWL